MEAEIITIGDELLIGQTVDTNSAYLGQKLGSIGISISRKTAISDNEKAILQAIAESQSRCNILDRKSTRLNSSHEWISRMPSSA